MKRERVRWIPKDSTALVDNGRVAVYGYGVGELCAVAYIGQATRHVWHYHFRRPEDRDSKVKALVESVAAHDAGKAARRKAQAEFRHGYQVGDILHYAWGWEQTQCEFYQVVETRERTITIQEIASKTVQRTGDMSALRMPVKDEFIGEPVMKRVSAPYKRLEPESKGSVSMAHGSASEWDGRPQHESWYG